MVAGGRLVVVTLDEPAQALAATLPRKLSAGEREAIGLAAQQRAVLLTNDRRALSYYATAQIATLDLKQLLKCSLEATTILARHQSCRLPQR
jgi:predicted nucleic acid-binding protein